MRMLREQGMAAFSTKKEEKEKALKKYEALEIKLAKEKEEEKRINSNMEILKPTKEARYNRFGPLAHRTETAEK